MRETQVQYSSLHNVLNLISGMTYWGKGVLPTTANSNFQNEVPTMVLHLYDYGNIYHHILFLSHDLGPSVGNECISVSFMCLQCCNVVHDRLMTEERQSCDRMTDYICHLTTSTMRNATQCFRCCSTQIIVTKHSALSIGKWNFI